MKFGNEGDNRSVQIALLNSIRSLHVIAFPFVLRSRITWLKGDQMKYWSEGKIDSDGKIFSNDMITEKEGYEAMLYTLITYLENSGSHDLTDILSG